MPRVLRYALIGNPVAHSLSPRMQAAAFAACGIDATYEAIRVTQQDAAAAVARLRNDAFDGFNVTTPLKDAIVALLDTLTNTAEAVAAVNTVRREPDGWLVGHNTDGEGLLRALDDVWEWRPGGRCVLILGSGPAARAFAHALRAGGAATVCCWSRNPQAAARIGPAITGVADLVISALPADATIPKSLHAAFDVHTRVFDANYAAARSPVPPQLGARRSDGLPLLFHQGALAFEWWTGRPAPLDIMRAALKSAS